MNWQGKRVLVTGAGGFIGGRLVERLVLHHGAEVRALVRNLAGAARLARFPVAMIGGTLQRERLTLGSQCVSLFDALGELRKHADDRPLLLDAWAALWARTWLLRATWLRVVPDLFRSVGFTHAAARAARKRARATAYNGERAMGSLLVDVRQAVRALRPHP